MQNIQQSSWDHEISDADRPSEQEQLLIRVPSLKKNMQM
jgi:hypothetical protein